MRYSLIQTSLDIPSVDTLKRAFRSVASLTDMDAFTLARDAFGVLVKHMSEEDAATLQGALHREGIETELVEDQRLPPLPQAKQVNRLDCMEDNLLIYDPLGRGFPLPWAHVMLVAAGQVNLIEFQRTTVVRPVIRYTGDGTAYDHEESDTVTREIRADRLVLEIIVSRAVLRYTAQGDKFNYQGLGDRRSRDDTENFRVLVREIATRAQNAMINRGALSLRENAPGIFAYPSKNAFYEEMIWHLWRAQRAAAES